MFRKLVYVLGVAVLALAFSQPSVAQIEKLEMRVDGMTSPFCVYGIEKKLKGSELVDSANANLKTGLVDIGVREGKEVDIESLNRAVRESGFTPGEIKLTATGRLTEHRGYPALRVKGTDQVFLLVQGKDHEKEELLSKNRLEEMEAATGNGRKEVTITGRIHAHADSPPALSVDSFRVK